jgi:peptidoglycan hydrolase-like protein with peptidoglycan-binding domain
VLGALLEGNALAGQMAKSQKNVEGIVSKERAALAAAPGASAYDSAKHPRASSGPEGGRFVKKGDTGAGVATVQKKLGVQPTGAFAFDTQAAVQNFQREHGLQVDGVVGAQTAQALLGNRNAKAVAPGALSSSDRKALGITTSVGKKAKAPKPAAPNRIGGGVSV